MTPLERVTAARAGRRPDKIPISTGPTNAFICHYYTISTSDYLHNTEFCSECSIKFIEEFKIDSSVVAPGYILYGCGPEMGVTWKFVDGHFPGFLEGPLKDVTDLDCIKVPQCPSGFFKHYLAVLEKVQSRVGQEYNLVGHILGPLSTACFLRGIERTFIDTIANQAFFKAYMVRCVDLCAYFGKHVLSTGINSTILNEIFLTPEMIRPDTYHALVSPFDEQVQDRLKPASVPNIMGAFMGKAGDRESQKSGVLLYKAFFGLLDSLDDLKRASEYALPGRPFPVAISGPALEAWETPKILSYFSESLDFLIKERNVYPTITLASVLAHNPEDAKAMAKKLEAIVEFRNRYQIG